VTHLDIHEVVLLPAIGEIQPAVTLSAIESNTSFSLGKLPSASVATTLDFCTQWTLWAQERYFGPEQMPLSRRSG
jgi:hypothetical protein